MYIQPWRQPASCPIYGLTKTLMIFSFTVQTQVALANLRVCNVADLFGAHLEHSCTQSLESLRISIMSLRKDNRMDDRYTDM
jgi:hypothetical protein